MTSDELRQLLATAKKTQRGMAQQLDINERTMRRWCSGKVPIPLVAVFAIKWVLFKEFYNVWRFS